LDFNYSFWCGWKLKPSNFLRVRATKNKKIAIIMARMLVAKVESTVLSPSLPKIATAAAKTADRNAYNNHITQII
jgi:hypothetical protein